MGRRSKKIVATNPLNWVITTEISINGRNVSPGTELSIKGERGRFRFMQHVVNANGVEWIDVVGGRKNYDLQRSFKIDRVKTVHRIARTRKNIG